MATFDINCPHCGKLIQVRDDWAGMKTHCAHCRGVFFIPKREVSETAPLPDAPGTASAERKKVGGAVKLVFKIILLCCLLGLGAWGVVWYMTPTPESLGRNQLYVMTAKRANRGKAAGMMDIAKHDFFPIVDSKKDFYYRSGVFKNIFLKEDDYEMYSGTVQFMRNNKVVTRPVTVDRRASFTNYRFPFKYADHPDYLEEDGDLIFALACGIDKKLQGWRYVSGKAEGDKLICTIEKDGVTKTVKLKAEQLLCKDNIGRIWVEILP